MSTQACLATNPCCCNYSTNIFVCVCARHIFEKLHCSSIVCFYYSVSLLYLLIMNYSTGISDSLYFLMFIASWWIITCKIQVLLDYVIESRFLEIISSTFCIFQMQAQRGLVSFLNSQSMTQ